MEIDGNRYRVVVQGLKLYSGDDMQEAIGQFASAAAAVALHLTSDEDGTLLGMQEGDPHMITGEPTVEAILGERLLGVLIGVTWQEWQADPRISALRKMGMN